jgi:hypothetical protein
MPYHTNLLPFSSLTNCSSQLDNISGTDRVESTPPRCCSTIVSVRSCLFVKPLLSNGSCIFLCLDKSLAATSYVGQGLRTVLVWRFRTTTTSPHRCLILVTIITLFRPGGKPRRYIHRHILQGAFSSSSAFS